MKDDKSEVTATALQEASPSAKGKTFTNWFIMKISLCSENEVNKQGLLPR